MDMPPLDKTKDRTEESVTVFWDKNDPKAVMITNGAHTFYALRKMNRDAVRELLEVTESKYGKA